MAVPGEARLEFTAAGPRNGALVVTARLTAPGSRIDVEGEIGRSAEGRFEPKLALRLDATDLRPLTAAFARASARALPAVGTLRLVRGDAGFALEEIKLSVADARVSGLSRAGGRIAALGLRPDRHRPRGASRHPGAKPWKCWAGEGRRPMERRGLLGRFRSSA